MGMGKRIKPRNAVEKAFLAVKTTANNKPCTRWFFFEPLGVAVVRG
jgi:hypothetical protein